MKLQFLFVLFLCLRLSLSDDTEQLPACTYDDFSYQLSSCQNNYRSILFSLNKKCDQSIEGASHLPVSKQEIECSSCKAGQYLHYNYEKGNLECLSCHENTYSTGGTMRLNGNYREWSNAELFSKFDNECYTVKDEVESENCKAFTLSKDASYIVSNNGFNIDNDYDYIAMLSIQVKLVQKGKIKFKYSKDTINENRSRIGLFRFYINYLSEYEDYNIQSTKDFKEVSFDLDKGSYSFLWQYLKTVDSKQTQSLAMKISDIEITGVETASTECKKCQAGTSVKGSDHCNFCIEGEYFDTSASKCMKCPKGTTSDFNAVGVDMCKVIPKCTESSYYKIISSKCDISTMKSKYHYELIKNSCIENESLKKEGEGECLVCQPGQYVKKIDDKYTKCEYCPMGTYSMTLNANKCEPCEGILSNAQYIIPENPLKYKSKIDINDLPGEIVIQYTSINSTITPNINIEIDSLPYSSPLISNEIIIPVNSGSHYLEIISENAIIDKITIKNGSTGGGYICSACTSGFLVKVNGKYVCENCGSGMELNENNECTLCQEGYYKRSNEHKAKCKKCPPLTESNSKRTNCSPVDVVTNHIYKLKYILSNYKKDKENLCSLTGGLCTNEFYGPIRNIANDDLYYLSYRSADIFNTTDFSYKYKSNIESSFVYKLNNDKDSYAKSNSKLVTSLGRDIAYIKMLNAEKKKGVVIKYKNGDKCENDPSKTYETILLLNCTKSQNEFFASSNSPKFIGTDQSKCLYYFSWSSSSGCPLCLSSQTSTLRLSCSNFQRSIYYGEGPQCIIDDTTSLSTNDDSNDNTSILVNDSDNIATTFHIAVTQASEMKLPLLTDDYIEKKKDNETCYLYDDFDKEILYVVIIVPICYVLIVGLCVYFWCKYRRISGDYHRLMEEPIQTNGDNPNISVEKHNQQIEMGSVPNSKNEEKLDKEMDVKVN